MSGWLNGADCGEMEGREVGEATRAPQGSSLSYLGDLGPEEAHEPLGAVT